jgi:hypothetical protein
MKLFYNIIILMCCCFTTQAQQFTHLPPTLTGVTFSNEIIENAQTNLFTYEYLYNGGGVAVGRCKQ